MAIYPLPEFGKPVRILNYYPYLMEYTNNMPLALALDTSLFNRQIFGYPVIAAPLDLNNHDFYFTFERGFSDGFFFIRHYGTGCYLAYGNTGEYDETSFIVCGHAINNQTSIDHDRSPGNPPGGAKTGGAYNFYITDGEYDMIAYDLGGSDYYYDTDIIYFLEATPTIEDQDQKERSGGDAYKSNIHQAPSGLPYVPVQLFPKSQGGTLNQRWTWEYV